ncbi:hypothetical protein [uncultured Erythrobacter sp.]|uniref:hypothetical protein n=1 Tax=uncultured Erythrobacter sp. TaxID=263913 RepID=UPI002601B978|nr:hypothetical protein [uncultured Erythrobacter sp.]
MFDAQFENELRKKTGLEPQTTAKLARAFEPIGKRFHKVLETTPTKFEVGPRYITPKKHLEWLEDNAREPLSKLVGALAKREKFSSRPDILASELTEADWTELTRVLGKLDLYSNELSDCIEGRKADKSTVNAELRFELICELADACELAGVEVSRDHHSSGEDTATSAIILKAASARICGKPFTLDHHLRDYLKLRPAKKLRNA